MKWNHLLIALAMGFGCAETTSLTGSQSTSGGSVTDAALPSLDTRVRYTLPILDTGITPIPDAIPNEPPVDGS